MKITSYGVRSNTSVRTRRAEATPGARTPPPNTTAGQNFASQDIRIRRPKGKKTTGQLKKEKPLKVMHWNAEGIFNKVDELRNLLVEKDIDVCCIQETHLTKAKTFKIRGYQKPFRLDRIDRHKGGVLTLVRNNVHAVEGCTHLDGAEYQCLKVKSKNSEINLVNYYCPNNRGLSLDSIEVNESFLIVGDFNSHSQSWGYDHTDARGEELEDWQDEHRLQLVNDPDDPPTFFHRGWRTCSTPDLAFCSEDINRGIKREVGQQLGGSDHKPVFLTLESQVIPIDILKPRWNYKKANWALFSIRTNELTKGIRVQGRNENHVVKEWNKCILQAAQETIPRGARRNYKPFWSHKLQELEEDLNEARERAEKEPSQTNTIQLQHAKAKFLKTKLEAKRRAWREKTSSLNMEKDQTALWRLTKSLNEEDSRGSTITLDEGGIKIGKQAADCFAKTYENASDLSVKAEQRRKARREQQRRSRKEKPTDIMTNPLTLQELEKVLSKLKKNKSPGPDGITNEMLTHLSTASRLKLLEIFNLTWEEGRLPQIWKEAIMMPVHKKGKDKSKSSSYRPISLTSCVVKTMERIVNGRMMWFLESNKILSEQQAGFRQFRSTEDQVTYLAQEVEDAFQNGNVLMATWIDLQKAFDKVWTDGLLVKVQRCGIGGKMYKWISSFLDNRRARVSVDGKQSRKFILRHGVPQGGVISPTLFLIFIDDLVSKLPKGVKIALYADDLVMWCSQESAGTARYRMQQAADVLTAWTEEWNVSINKEKSSTTLFTITQQKIEPIVLGGTRLKQDDEPNYLGITYDKRQTWKPHLQAAETKSKRKLALMRKLTGSTWGANEKTLKTVYQGSVRPYLEYGATAWSTAAKTNLHSIDKVQNQALRIITGAMKSTPITAMEEVTGIQPLKTRRDMKILIQAEKFKCQQGHPMKERMNKLGRGRIQRENFVSKAKQLGKDHLSHLPPETLSPIQHNCKPWEEVSLAKVKICTSIPGIYPGDKQADIVKCNIARAYIEESYPDLAWNQIYTDGSATNAVSNGGAGVFFKDINNQITKEAIPTGKHCNNYKAEVEALKLAVRMAKNSSTDEYSQFVFLTDAASVLDSLTSGKEQELRNLLKDLADTNRVALQWIPSHCGIPGNEAADQLAKEGARGIQIEEDLSFYEKKTLIKSVFKMPSRNDDYHHLDREDQVKLFRLRTGHNRLNSHMHRKLKMVPSSACSCQRGEQTAEHILQVCPRFDDLRKEIWPDMTSLETKLFGDRVELIKTTKFIKLCGLNI